MQIVKTADPCQRRAETPPKELDYLGRIQKYRSRLNCICPGHYLFRRFDNFILN